MQEAWFEYALMQSKILADWNGSKDISGADESMEDQTHSGESQ